MKPTKLLLSLMCSLPLAAAIAQNGPGNGMGGMGYRFDGSNTAGWKLMSAEERNEHRQKMWNAKSYDECKAIQAEHHQQMAARAKAQGKTLMTPRNNACDRMKARGKFN